MYCSSWDGLLCSKRLSTGVGKNGKSFILDQDLETSCCATSAKKKKRIIGSSCILQQLCWVLLSVFLWIFRYFTRLADPQASPSSPCLPQGVRSSCSSCTCGWARKAKLHILVCVAAKDLVLCPTRSGHSLSCSHWCHILGFRMFPETVNQMLLFLLY